jgi:hypothetical protein
VLCSIKKILEKDQGNCKKNDLTPYLDFVQFYNGFSQKGLNFDVNHNGKSVTIGIAAMKRL